MAEENGSSVQLTPGTKEECAIPPASIEEGVPQGTKTTAKIRLSAVSKKYDVNGDGTLDEAEQAMRDMDKEGLGYLTNDKVYSIFQEQLRMQKQLLFAKKLLIFFAALLILLAVANIGVAFAAARLAKDTQADPESNALVIKDTGEVVATDTHAVTFGVTTDTSDSAERLLGTAGSATTIGDTESEVSITTMSIADALMMHIACRNGMVIIERTWPGSNEVDEIQVCPGASYSYDRDEDKYIYVKYNGKRIRIHCNNNRCRVRGNALEQQAGQYCLYDSDCAPDAPQCVNNECFASN